MWTELSWQEALQQNWTIWLVTIVLVVAATIDGLKLKVPNWITFPMVISGWIYSAGFSQYAGWEGLLYSLGGTVVGLGVMLPLYSVGGMGAGDVKLNAGIGAWVWIQVTLYAFCATAIVGGILAIAMVIWSGSWEHHRQQFWKIWNEIVTIRDPEKLSEIAAERKPTMRLLPYGIPMAIGTIGYFWFAGMLI